jgi:hypothetical protein
MKKFISLTLCSLFLAQVASAAEQPAAHRDVRWKRVAPHALITFVSGGSAFLLFNQVIQKEKAAKVAFDNLEDLKKLPEINRRIFLQEKQEKEYRARVETHAWMLMAFPSAFLTLAASMCSYEALFM